MTGRIDTHTVETPIKPVVAWLGLGLMGRPMVNQLLKAGLNVSVWNRTPSKAEAIAHTGARVAASAREAVESADIVFTMLENGEAVTEVLFADDLQCAVRSNTLFIDMSSIPVQLAREHSSRLTRRGYRYLDAPVSGGPAGAEAGTLAIMVGGQQADFHEARPVLNRLGRCVHVGAVGAGQITKLANQVIVSVTIGAVAEALALAGASGADPASAINALRGGFADGAVLQRHGQRMVSRDFSPGAPSRLEAKDLAAIASQAAALNLNLPLTERVTGMYSELVADGHGELDHSALLLHIERINSR